MKTIKLPYKTEENNKIDVIELQRQQNCVIRYSYNRLEDGRTQQEIREMCKHLNHVEKMDSWFIQCAICKADEILKSKIEIEKENKKHNEKEEDRKKHKSEKISIIFGGKDNWWKRVEHKISKEEYKKNRLMPLQIQGEAPQRGNRKFNFHFEENKVVFKPEKGKAITLLLPKIKKDIKKQLLLAQKLAKEKKTPISIELTDSYICFKFDEFILSTGGYDRIKERVLAYDENPDGIGYSVLEFNNNSDIPKVLKAEYIELKELNKERKNKRQYENIKLCQKLVNTTKHYKVGTIVSEDLTIESKDHGNRTSNRKNNNEWNRTFRKKKLQMLCNVNNIELKEVNPCYSSFVGNLMYNYFDPVNASIEIGRRGIYKFVKGRFYPPIQLIKNEWKDALINVKDSWVKLFKRMRDVKYRVLTMSNHSVFRFSSIKSRIKLYNFI